MMASFIFADDIDAWNNFVLQIIWAERSEFDMAVAHKGSISMGMVLIPIGLYKTTVDNDIHFNQLEKESKARIKYKKYCSHCQGSSCQKNCLISACLTHLPFQEPG